MKEKSKSYQTSAKTMYAALSILLKNRQYAHSCINEGN